MCKAGTGCLPPLFGKEMRIWVCRSQLTQPSEGASPERLLPAFPKFAGYPYLFWGVPSGPPGDGMGLLGGASEEIRGCGFSLALSTSPAHTDGTYSRWWGRAWRPCWDQSWLVRHVAPVSRARSLAFSYRSNPSKGKWFEIRQTGEWLPQSVKIILFHA